MAQINYFEFTNLGRDAFMVGFGLYFGYVTAKITWSAILGVCEGVTKSIDKHLLKSDQKACEKN